MSQLIDDDQQLCGVAQFVTESFSLGNGRLQLFGYDDASQLIRFVHPNVHSCRILSEGGRFFTGHYFQYETILIVLGHQTVRFEPAIRRHVERRWNDRT